MCSSLVASARMCACARAVSRLMRRPCAAATIVVSGAIEVKARDTLRRVPRVRPRTPLPATTAKPAAQDELQTVEGYNAKQFKATASEHQALFDTFESRP